MDVNVWPAYLIASEIAALCRMRLKIYNYWCILHNAQLLAKRVHFLGKSVILPIAMALFIFLSVCLCACGCMCVRYFITTGHILTKIINVKNDDCIF